MLHALTVIVIVASCFMLALTLYDIENYFLKKIQKKIPVFIAVIMLIIGWVIPIYITNILFLELMDLVKYYHI